MSEETELSRRLDNVVRRLNSAIRTVIETDAVRLAVWQRANGTDPVPSLVAIASTLIDAAEALVDEGQAAQRAATLRRRLAEWN